MPVVAESPPLIFGGTPAPTPIPTVTPTPTPRPIVTPTPAPISPGAALFVTRHQRFIGLVDGLNACFKRTEISEFTDQEFSDHATVAIMDKYIAQEKDMFCSMQGVNALTKTLRRLGEE